MPITTQTEPIRKVIKLSVLVDTLTNSFSTFNEEPVTSTTSISITPKSHQQAGYWHTPPVQFHIPG